MRALAAGYAITVGALMATWWLIELRGGALQRGDRTRAEMGFHLAAEFATAAALIAGGIVLLTHQQEALALVGLGMLLYTVVQSPGYFVARGERAFAFMFAALQVTTLVVIVALLSLVT